MAASSPVLSNNGGETTPTTTITTTTTSFTPPLPPPSPALSTVTLQKSDPSKNLRGLNKPKCIKCGNVARSRCPYQSCKSCCSKAQNPCHIHVLKPNATLADRGASANTATTQQQQQPPNEVPSSGPSTKVSSLRQLSSTFSQFSNVHIPIRSRKPVTRKEALAINTWRFAKLKEYKERNIEAEHEAFDRYMQNICLLEETFNVNTKNPEKNSPLLSNPPTTSGNDPGMISEMKVKLRSDPVRTDKFRKRIHQAVDQGLRKLQKHDLIETANNLIDEGSLDSTPNSAENWTWKRKSLALVELNERLNKARNEEDLKLCMEMRSKIRGEGKTTSSGEKTESADVAKEKSILGNFSSAQEPDYYKSMLKLVRTSEIDQDGLSSIESHFSSLEEIEDL